MVEVVKREWVARVAVGFFVVTTVWWVALFLSGVQQTFYNYLFGATYGLMALWGGAWGLLIAKKWGGFSSVIGQAIIGLSLGLLAQEFGQVVFSFYNLFLGVEIPYPSLADVGFFGSIPLYIVGIYLLAKASGTRFSLRAAVSKLQVAIIPILMLTLSYIFFLRDYEFNVGDPLKIFLDFGYPMGQALYISIAILTYTLSRRLLGGIMRSKILFLVVAFVVQYLADYNFLFQSSRGTWVNGGYGDYVYLVAYFLMTLGLIQFKTVAERLGEVQS